MFCVSLWQTGLGCSSTAGGPCTGSPLRLSSHHSGLTAFKLTAPPDRAGLMLQTGSGGERGSGAGKTPSAPVEKKMRALRCTACKDLNVAAVLSSSAALGSVTPAAREDGYYKRKGGASIRAKWRELCSQKRTLRWGLLGGRFPPLCFSFYFLFPPPRSQKTVSFLLRLP